MLLGRIVLGYDKSLFSDNSDNIMLLTMWVDMKDPADGFNSAVVIVWRIFKKR